LAFLYYSYCWLIQTYLSSVIQLRLLFFPLTRISYAPPTVAHPAVFCFKFGQMCSCVWSVYCTCFTCVQSIRAVKTNGIVTYEKHLPINSYEKRAPRLHCTEPWKQSAFRSHRRQLQKEVGTWTGYRRYRLYLIAWVKSRRCQRAKRLPFRWQRRVFTHTVRYSLHPLQVRTSAQTFNFD